MRVLILTIYYDPEPIPKTGELARELLRRGHEVTVVTAFPHYPTGQLYPGYTLALWRRDVVEGVNVVRTFIYPYHGTRASLRILNYVTWMLSSTMAAWLAPACDVIYVWHPPLTVGISAWVVSKLKRVPFVYDVQDLWPESALASGLMQPGRLVSALYRLADWVYARAPRILVVSEAAATHLQRRGVPPAKVSIARHWFDDTPFRAADQTNMRPAFGLRDEFIVMFAGNLGIVQGLETVIEAAELLSASDSIRFIFVGDGADRPRLERLVADRKLSTVTFAGQHPASQMPSYLSTADALLVHIRPSEIAAHAIPTKILAYLAAARPIICAMRGAAGELVTAAAAGPVLDPGNPQALAMAVKQLAATPADERYRIGQRGREFLEREFDKSRVIDFYERVLQEAAGTFGR